MFLLLSACLLIDDDTHAARIAEVAAGPGGFGGFGDWPDATGEVGLVGELSWIDTVGVRSRTDPDHGEAWMQFTNGFDDAFHLRWAPRIGSCTHTTEDGTDWSHEPDLVPVDAGGGTVTVSSDTSSVVLGWNAGEQLFEEDAIEAEQFSPGEQYDLSIRGAPGLPDTDLVDVFRAPSRLDLVSPPIESPVIPPMDADQRFVWAPDDPGEAVILVVAMEDLGGDEFEETVTCVVPDNGTFSLKSSDWQDWDDGRRIHLLVGRYRTSKGTLPWNNADIEMGSVSWVYGYAESQ